MNETKTVTIPIDEYFDMRTKIEMNAYLIERLGQLEVRILDMERVLWEIEQKVKGGAE